MSHEVEKKKWMDEEKKFRGKRKLLIASTHHAGLASIPSSLLQVGSLRLLDSLCPWDLYQTTGERTCCIVEMTLKEILVQNAHFIREVVTSWTSCPLLLTDVMWPYQSSKDTGESETFMDSKNLQATVSLIWVMLASSTFESACFVSRSLVLGNTGTLISGLRRHVFSARSCGGDLDDHQSVFRTLWRFHGSWCFAILAEFRTLVSHEGVLSMATLA